MKLLAGAPFSAFRALSLLLPGGDDDMFSSDFSDAQFKVRLVGKDCSTQQYTAYCVALPGAPSASMQRASSFVFREFGCQAMPAGTSV